MGLDVTATIGLASRKRFERREPRAEKSCFMVLFARMYLDRTVRSMILVVTETVRCPVGHGRAAALLWGGRSWPQRETRPPALSGPSRARRMAMPRRALANSSARIWSMKPSGCRPPPPARRLQAIPPLRRRLLA